MAQPNLLEIVPDELFQTHNIASIINVQKKLHDEIEFKREELRAMVGERYRELIHAADTIEEMRESTATTLNHIDNMMSTCRGMENTYSVGIKAAQKPVSKSVDSTTNPVYITSVQVKILMEIPENIWKCIDNEDFIKATQLFILARHINTGLQLQIGGANTNPGMRSMQRLIQQQWNCVSNFNQTIVDLCKKKLQDVDISIEVATACLISLHFLDSQGTSELLDTLIALTSDSSLRRTLEFDVTKIQDGNVKAKIKEKIVGAVKIILKTVVLVYACFVENDGGSVAATLDALLSPDSAPLLALVHCSEPLPPAVASYRLSAPQRAPPPPGAAVVARVHGWSAGVRGAAGRAVRSLLAHATRARAACSVRAAARDVELPANWSQICAALELPTGHVWATYFQDLLTSRVKEIIDARWARVYDSFRTQTLADLTRVCEGHQTEADINWFVWRDLIGDTVIESRSEVVGVMTTLMKGMWLQDRGFTPSIESLCRSLDSELQNLLEDLSAYLYRERGTVGDTTLLYTCDDDDDADVYSDREEVLQYLREVSDGNVKSILQYIRACFDEPTLQTTELQKKTTSIYTARFTQAIVHLIPHLYKCYISKESQDTESVERWNHICTALKENTLYCWGKWVDIALVKVEELTTLLPQEFTLEANVDYLMMQWDTIQIQEKDDEGTTVETQIKLPSGPSLKLQEYLYSCARILDEVVPHTLPSEIHALFVEKLADISLAHFDKAIREKGTDINQRCALQLLMDVRHLTMLLVSRENKHSMDRSQEVCEMLRHKIDPFDYDVFYPHIQSNLKRSVQRVQTLMGSLVLNHGQLTGVVGKTAPSSGGPAQLAAAGDARRWFSLLPLAAPLATRATNEPKKKPVPSGRARGPPPPPPPAARSAASFFTSLSADWFSGS